MKNARLFLSCRNIVVAVGAILLVAGFAAAMEVCKFNVDPRFAYAALAAEIVLVLLSVAFGAVTLYKFKTPGANGQYHAAVLAGSSRACRACRRGGYAVPKFVAVLMACFMFVTGLFFTCINISVAVVTSNKNFVQVIHAGGGDTSIVTN